MKGLAFIIPVSGPIREIELTEPVPLKLLQEAVGGYIEAVPYFSTYEGEPCVAFCNENGKLDGLSLNIRATEAWDIGMGGPLARGGRAMSDVLVGDVIIITGDVEMLEEL
jgi:hypothetical protein